VHEVGLVWTRCTPYIVWCFLTGGRESAFFFFLFSFLPNLGLLAMYFCDYVPLEQEARSISTSDGVVCPLPILCSTTPTMVGNYLICDLDLFLAQGTKKQAPSSSKIPQLLNTQYGLPIPFHTDAMGKKWRRRRGRVSGGIKP
jgi:hypothetical protein